MIKIRHAFIVLPLLLLGFGSRNDKPGKGVYIDTTVTNFFKRTSGWIASDGGLTVPLRDGKTLWLMGDSHIDDYDAPSNTIACLFQVRNCVLLQPPNDWQWQHTNTFTGTGPGSKSYFKFNPDDNYFSWPLGGVQLNDTIYVYCTNLKKVNDTSFGWGSGGFDMWGKIKYPEMKVVGFKPLQDFAGINFGFSMVKDEAAGYVYVYGSKLKIISGKIYVARFPINNPNIKWEFWDRKKWNADPAKSKTITRTPSNAVSVCKVNNKYLLFTAQFSVGCDQGKDIYVATASSPIGPFSKHKVIYSIPDRKNGHSPFFYSVFGHPEFINNKNELLVTYSINGYDKCMPDCVNNRSDPDIYRPRGIRVPLKLIDAEL